MQNNSEHGRVIVTKCHEGEGGGSQSVTQNFKPYFCILACFLKEKGAIVIKVEDSKCHQTEHGRVGSK